MERSATIPSPSVTSSHLIAPTADRTNHRATLGAVHDAYGDDKGLAYALAEAKRKHKKHLGTRLKRQPSLMNREPSDEEVMAQLRQSKFGSPNGSEPGSPMSGTSPALNGGVVITAHRSDPGEAKVCARVHAYCMCGVCMWGGERVHARAIPYLYRIRI